MADDDKPKGKVLEATEIRTDLSEEELHEAISGAAIFSNKLYVSTQPMGVRIAFCEQREDIDALHFRTAVYLSIPDAMSLRDILTKHLDGYRIELVERDGDGNGDE